MSTFGTGTTTTGGSSIVLTAYTGTNGQQAGTDGLVPGPSVAQQGYVLGAGGDWVLTIKEINDLNDSSTRIATTDFVQTLVGNAQLGGGNANLSALGDTQFANLAADQFLQYNGNKWVNVTFNLDTIANVNLAGLQVGNTIVWDGNEFVPGIGGGGGANALNDLTDVSIAGGAENHFLVRNAQGQFVNRLISTADLSNSANVVLNNSDATFGNHNYDFTGATTITVPAPTADTHASTKKYVDDEVSGIDLSGKQDADASLDTITGIADGDLLLGNGVNSFEKISVSAGVETVLKGTGSVGTLSDVDLANVADGKILKYNNGSFIVADETDTNTQLTDDQVKDIVGGQMLGGTETGISVSYDAVNRDIDFVVSLGGFSIRDLGDVSNDALVNGKILKVVNGALSQADETDTQLTDEQVQDIVGGMVAGNTETGISVTYDENDGAGDGNGKLNFAVSLGINDLTDVSTAGVGNGQVLKFNNGNFEAADDTGKTAEEIEDIVGGMFTENNAGNTFITFSYNENDGAGEGNGNITATVSLSSTDLGDGGNVSRLDANQTLSGDKTFTGGVDLTGATTTVANPTQNTHPTTKSYVDTQVATKQATNANLTSISGLNIIDGSMMIGNGANSFEILAIQLGVENFLKSSGRIASLSDITFDNDELVNANHFIVSTGAGGFQNTTISTANLSNSGDIVLETANASFGANTYDFTGATAITVPAPQNASDATTKTYVDTQVATKQPLEATLTGLATIAPVDNDLIIATGNDTFGVINTTAGVQTFLASDAELGDLEKVTIAADIGNGNDGETLRWDGANLEWKNSKLAFGDLNQNVGSTQNVALLNGNQTFSGTITFTNDITATTQGKFISANTPTADSHVATKKYVDDEMGAAGLVSSLTTLTDVTIGADGGNGVAEAVGQVLKIASIANGDATYRNAQLAYTELSGTPTIGTDIQAYNVALDSLATMGTGANKIIYSTAEDTFAESDITDYTRLLLAEANEGAVKSYLNLEIGTDVQAQNATLQGIAGIGGVADGKIIYTDGGADTFATSDISAFALTILDDADAGAVRTTLQLGTASTSAIGDFLASTSDLNALSDVTIGADNGNGVAEAVGQVLRISALANGEATYRNEVLGVSDVSGISDFAETFLDDADAGAVRATLQLGTASTSAIGDFLASTSGLNALSDVTLANPSDAQILIFDGDEVGNDNDQFKNVSVSGVIAISNSGVVSFATDAIDENNIATAIKDGVITNTYLASSFVNLTASGNTNKLNLGEEITFEGTANEVEVSTTADANGDVAGATITLGLPDNVTIGNNLTVTGNLTVNGTTTTVDTTNMVIEDRVISLNTGGNNDKDMGLFFDRGQNDPALFIFDQDVGRFKVGTQNGATASQDNNYALTVIGMEVATPANNSNGTEVATTAWVRDFNTNQGNAADLDGLTDVGIGDVALADAHILVYDDANNEFRNKAVSGDIEISNAGVVSISEEAIVNADINAGAAIAVSKLASSSVTVGTTEITLGNASTTLSGMTGIDFAVGNASIASSIGNSTLTLGGANTTVDVAGVLTVNAPTAGGHATNKTYVDTKQPLDATLTALADLETGAKKLIYSTANDTLEMISLSDNAKTFIASSAGLTNLDGVTIGGVALAEKHFLVQNDAGQFVNRLITTSDLQNGSNIALLDANQTFTGIVQVSTQAEGNDTTRVASTAFVQQEITALDLANTFQGKDATLTALAGVATAANKLIYATDADTFTTTDLSAFGRTLIDDADATTARSTLGLVIGTNVQAYNSDLAGIASIGGVATGKIIYTKTVNDNVVWDEATFTDYAKGLVALGAEANVKSYLNLESGVDVQAYNASLQSISALGTAGNKLIYTTNANTFAESDLTAFARTILDDGDASTARTTLGVAIGSDVQAYDASLQSISALGTAGNKLIYTTGENTFAESDLTAFARTILDDADAGAVRTTLGVAIGSDVQAYDASLQSISALGTGANKLIYTTDENTFAESDLTAFARTILDDADSSTVRATLELGDSSTLDTTITGGNADAGKVVKTDGDGKLGAIDGANLTALGSIGLHSNVDLTDIAHGQGLVYSTTNGVNRFEPGTVPTTGTNVTQTPTITSQSISLNPNALVGGDLVIYGRVMEVIDYGSVADAFNNATDYAIDFGSLTDTVIYCAEDYGVLVV